MMELPIQEGSKEWWDQKYAASSDYLYGKEPSKLLVDHMDLIAPGETLDVAMGEGRNAVYLASKDCKVTGVDFNETAVDRAKNWPANLALHSRPKM